ncbi:phosphatidate cytidylyltransferase [Salirhabdus salicampi]|uniref:phosphatidate cytidylyltransferase n=1 Tax=Salirhabdus salicampi TaxID=476102 RepID=UPI0020C3E082|nr:phosphatidate cytidylyltransferase [Salirhabdus salicampi]MCP8616286.1 phosphatidate cytidylyltransferase [Salirhabdus salicampi]
MTIIPGGILLVLIFIFSLLITGHIIVYLLRKKIPSKDYHELILRIQSWWYIFLGFFIFIVLNKTLAIITLAFLSFLALKEYLSLIPTRRADRRVLFFAYLAIPVHYYWIGTEWYGMFIIFIPVYVFLFIHILMILIGETKGFLKAAGTLHWGLMITVFGFSHLAYFIVMPNNPSLPSSNIGLVLFIVLLTQLNDVFQYVWGKVLGKRKIIPSVSPNKTVEGFVGGVATTTILSVLLAPWLTPMNIAMSIIAGIIIGIGGFVGDLTISAFKRDLRVKDTGHTIPGHGGILDRIDSLTFTVPVFFHFIRYFYF